MKIQTAIKPMTRKTALIVLAVLLTTFGGLTTWAVISGQSHLLANMAPIFVVYASVWPKIAKALRANQRG
jgi:hypothetical protein